MRPALNLSCLCILLSSCAMFEPKNITFGAIADCQYSDQADRGVRKYSTAHIKLKESVDHFNQQDLDFVIQLGDLIDKNFKSFDTVLPIYDQLKAPRYQVLGNHDYDVEDSLKKDVPAKMGMHSNYYEFEQGEWRFIVLDGNEFAFHTYPTGSKEYQASEKYYIDNNIALPKWNGAIGKEQMQWLNNKLQDAQTNKQKVIIFCHYPVYPADPHNLWNSSELVTLIEQYPCVKAYLNGHNHKGKYGEKNGVHYLTLKGMLDTSQNSYAIVKIHQYNIEIKGFGREENRLLPIK